MSKPETRGKQTALAEAKDIKSMLGDLDNAKVLDILALQPTVRDVEDAVMWISGDPDIFGAGESLKGVAAEIVAIVTADEQEEPPRVQ
jgi:hypothetical protein